MRALVAPPENRGYSHEELTCESDMLRYGSLCTCGRHGAAPFRLAD